MIWGTAMGKLKKMVLGLVGICCVLSGCTFQTNSPSQEQQHIELLTIALPPSGETQHLMETIHPLQELLQSGLEKQGWSVGKILISSGSSYEAVGDALENGTADLGFIPKMMYVDYQKECTPLLQALRYKLSKDFSVPEKWNDKKSPNTTSETTSTYRGLILAGPSPKGIELAEKIANGEEISFEELSQAKWSVLQQSSPAGKVYPELWLCEKYQKGLEDLPYLVEVDSYEKAFSRLANQRADIICVYADARKDFAYHWNAVFRMEQSIWQDTAVIGVTNVIENEILACTNHSEKMTPALQEAIQTAFLEVIQTPQGQQAMSIYGHVDYRKMQQYAK